MIFLGFTPQEIASLLAVSAAAWKFSSAAAKATQGVISKYVKSQIGDVTDILLIHSESLKRINMRIDSLEGEVRAMAGSQVRVSEFENVSKDIHQATVESLKAAAAIKEMAVKFAESKPVDHGKVILKP